MRSDSTYRVASALLATALLLGTTVSARADLDVTISNNTIVQAELSPADETETYRFTAAAGSKVAITLKAKRVKRVTPPALTVFVLDSDGQKVAEGILKRKTVKVRGFVPAATGEYRIVVSGDGENTGAYVLKAKWKPPARSKVTLPQVDGTTSHTFAAAPGSKAVIKVAAPRKSTALPRLGNLQSVDKEFQFDDFPAPKPTAKSHVRKKVELGPQRDFQIAFENTGETGDIVVDVKLKAPRTPKTKVDLRDESIGGGEQVGASGGKPQNAFGGVVGPAGGSLGVDDDVAGILAGTGLVVPAGAMTAPVAITFGEAINDFPAPNGIVETLGPTVFFGPSGLEFEIPASCTIPWDFETYAGELEDIEVYARDEDGTIMLIPGPYVFDLEGGTCTFPVSHFTSFRVFAPPVTVFVENELCLSPTDAANGDKVATSVAIDGNVLVIGAPEADADASQDGAVYVYTRDQKGWGFQQKLTASDASNSSGFGESVAVSGTTIVVGAPLALDRSTRPGAVYVFEMFQADWEETQKLIGTTVSNGDGFGAAVAIDGDILLASAPGESIGTGDDNAGAVYVFEPLDGWVETERFEPDDTQANQRFGASLALEGDRCVVGAPGQLIGGRAFVFDRVSFEWTQTAELLHGETDGEEDFGVSVALLGDRAIVGDDAFDDPDENGRNAGRAWIFENGAAWTLEQTLAPPVIQDGSRFGESVTLTLDFAVVGHPAANIPPGGSGAGLIHVFENADGAWPAVVSRGADTPGVLEGFGSALTANGLVLVVGEPGRAQTTGAAYLYDIRIESPAVDR